MRDPWQFQVRITVSQNIAQALREQTADAGDGALQRILREHGASLVCQYDAFADYVTQAEQAGPEHYPLYRWTKNTIDDPQKKAKYLRSFTVYVNGEQIYEKAIADSLQAQLSALVGQHGIEAVNKFDTNPANNPQPPAPARGDI
ncbi:hypothetical protein LJR230_005056 [Trinickia sp. LjRoot230]|uniref:hypothetical protein n=1 Tax=Trinickia sp. LjRoot230 TaxID=3342288 RepID=UPI003ECCFFA7